MNSILPKNSCSFMLRSLNKQIRRGFADAKSSEIKVHTETNYVPPSSTLGDVHKVSNVEKYFLVWTKKFKSRSEVPNYVSRDMMEKARNIMRIKVNLSIIALCLVGALFAAKSGKKAAERGESVIKSNLEWHRTYNEAQSPQKTKSEN